MTNNILMIDLTQFQETDETKSVEQISNFLKSLSINTNIKWFAQDLHYAKSGIMVWGKPFTWSKNWSKVWFFKDTLKIFAFENCDGKNFTSDFVDFMENLTPLVPGGTPVFFNTDPYVPYDDEKDECLKTQCKTIDDVLDKINNHGIDSLTDEEKDILNEGL